jgi:hypothetical protein
LARQRPIRAGAGGKKSGSANLQRLREALGAELPEMDAKHTVQIDRATEDTRADPKKTKRP